MHNYFSIPAQTESRNHTNILSNTSGKHPTLTNFSSKTGNVRQAHDLIFITWYLTPIIAVKALPPYEQTQLDVKIISQIETGSGS